MGVLNGKIQIFAAGVQALQAVFAAFDQVNGIVQRHTITGGQHEIANGLVAEFVCDLAHSKEVSGALGHFHIVNVQKAVVHPIVAEAHAVGALGLCNLVFVMGEDQVLSACVQIDGGTQMLAAHGTALNVPARAAHAVGAFPCRLAGLGGFPHGKVGGVFLQIIVHLAAQLTVAAFQILQIQMAQLAIFGKAFYAEIYIAVFGHIGMAALDQILYNIQNFGNMIGSVGLHGGAAAVQPVAVLQIFGGKALGHFFHGHAFFVGLFNELIVNIGDVAHIDHLVAAPLQIVAQGVKHDQGAGVADVNIIVNGGAAHINAVFTGFHGHKFFFFAGQSVKDLHELSPLQLPQQRAFYGWRHRAVELFLL